MCVCLASILLVCDKCTACVAERAAPRTVPHRRGTSVRDMSPVAAEIAGPAANSAAAAPAAAGSGTMSKVID
jgi:hypothetical protein